MKTILCGSRTIQSYDALLAALAACGFADQITTVFTGMASGPDIFGYRWALERKLPVRPFLPDWKTHGKPAGIIRNMEMVTYADAMVALWDTRSTGTKHIIAYSKKMQPPLRVYVHLCPEFIPQNLVTQGRKESDETY